MIPELTFLTPLKADSTERVRNWDIVYRHYKDIPAQWIVAETGSRCATQDRVTRLEQSAFSIAQNRNVGIKSAKTPHLCSLDADLLIRWSDFHRAYEEFVSGGFDIYSPYSKVVRATPKNSVIACERRAHVRWSYLMRGRGNWRQPANYCGGSVFMTREVAERLDGYDERFDSWGFEDVALDKLARKLGMKMGMHRGNCYHLWHPPARKRAKTQKLFVSAYSKPAEEIASEKSRVKINRFEYHVTDTCNLHCVQCSHYSNFTTKGMRTAEQVREELTPWSKKILPGMVCLLGGEPTLNKELVPILYVVRELYPKADLMLVTNGFFLDRHPELPSAVIDLSVNLQVSNHHDSETYQERFAKVLEVLERWRREHPGFEYNVRESLKKWIQQYEHREDGKAYPIRSRPTYAWKACVQKYCHQIYQGKLWKCPAIAYFKNLEKKLGLEDVSDWDRFRDYQPLSADCTYHDLVRFVNERAISACGLCPQNPEQIPIPNPMQLPVVIRN